MLTTILSSATTTTTTTTFPVIYSCTQFPSSSYVSSSSNSTFVSLNLTRTRTRNPILLRVRASSSMIEKERPESQRPLTFLRESDDELSSISDSNSTSSSTVRARFEKMIREAQDSVCLAIEAVDGGGKFKEDVWSRPGGGGGISRVLQDGDVWDKAGVNVSVVYGVMPPEAYRAAKPANSTDVKPGPVPFFAAGISSRYDPDPAAKAAAATVLASKLGADSGLKLYVGDESNLNPTAKSNDVELVQSSGLRNRKQLHTRSSSAGSTVSQHSNEELLHNTAGIEVADTSNCNQLVVEHHQPGSTTHDGGWIARIAALLVGEDPTQSYALICGNCHMHNGLARQEDFPYITYYCPHCNALNRSKQQEGVPNSDSPRIISSVMASNVNPIRTVSGTMSDGTPVSSSPLASVVETVEVSETVVSANVDPVS